MRADKANEHQPLRVAYGNKQTEVVTLDIEDHPIVCQKTGVAMDGLDVGGRSPIRIADFGIPAPQGNFGLRMAHPEFTQCFDGDNSHVSI